MDKIKEKESLTRKIISQRKVEDAFLFYGSEIEFIDRYSVSDKWKNCTLPEFVWSHYLYRIKNNVK